MTTLYGLPETVRWCSRCVMSNQRPASAVEHKHTIDSKKTTLRIDDEGVCDACRVADLKRSINWPEREAMLVELLERHRSRDGSFDVVVPGSGGKDSFMAAHLLKHKYGMHPLLVTWPPNIPTPWGVRNLERWQEIADHVMYRPARPVHRLITRLAVERLFHPFAAFIYGQKNFAPKIAARYGIKLCLYGEGESEYGNPIAEAHTAQRSAEYYSANDDELFLGGTSLAELRDVYRLERCDIDAYLPGTPEMLRNVDVRYLGFYVRWHPQGAYYYAVDHGGFECSPERTPGTYSKYNSIDDALDDYHYWCTFQKFGIGRATYDAAQEIRSGDITREEGVALVHRFDGEYPERFEREVNDYLSVDGFPPMTRERWMMLAEKFRSPHLWDGETLRHRVQ